MMELAIALVLVGLGAVILVGGYRFYRRLMARAAELSIPRQETPAHDVVVSGDVHADGLVYLFAHEFVQHRSPRPTALPRERAFAPLTEAELDPEDWALQLLYATLCDLHAQSAIQFRIVEREATLMPPFPQKRWEMELIQRMPFPSSPIADALGVAVELMRSRQQQRVAQGKAEPGELWCPLDELIERALKAMRQEITFWERSGVYGDLRNYVASALVAQGYLIQPASETWLQRSRSRRPRANELAIDRLRPQAEALKRRLRQFRLKHGSPYARGELEPEEGQRLPLANVDPALTTGDPDCDNMPLDDCLRISIHEALVSLRQLEPSGDAGI